MCLLLSKAAGDGELGGNGNSGSAQAGREGGKARVTVTGLHTGEGKQEGDLGEHVRGAQNEKREPSDRPFSVRSAGVPAGSPPWTPSPHARCLLSLSS